MKQILGFTKDLNEKVVERLSHESKKDNTVNAEMSLENFTRLQCMVTMFLREAEQKKEDAVATHQLYLELAEALDSIALWSVPQTLKRPSSMSTKANYAGKDMLEGLKQEKTKDFY